MTPSQLKFDGFNHFALIFPTFFQRPDLAESNTASQIYWVSNASLKSGRSGRFLREPYPSTKSAN